MSRAAAGCYWPRALIHVDAAGRAGALDAVRAVVAPWPVDVRTLPGTALDIDVTHCQTRAGAPELIGRRLLDAVRRDDPGVSLALGIAHDPLVARLAAALSRGGRDAMTVIPPWEARERLGDLPLDLIDFVDPRLLTFLSLAGVRRCGEVAALPVALLERRFGVAGRRLWLLCRGRDSAGAVDEPVAPRALVHAAVLPPRTDRPRTIEAYLRHGCRLLTRRLRRLGLEAGSLRATLRYVGDDGAAESALVRRVDLGPVPVDAVRYFEPLRAALHPELGWRAVSHAWLAAERLRGAGGQLDLFIAGRAA
ncbi:MAG TPA: hypothetical protein VGA00_03100 [Acidiferrobacterales bacterium]